METFQMATIPNPEFLRKVGAIVNKSPLKESSEQAAERISAPELVAASAIARRMSVTGRYILQLAAQGCIPCVRIGPKCVRFSPDAVAKALGFTWGASA